MKLRLAIAGPSGAVTSFEHGGPVVRIGREPGCELVLDAQGGTAVSRQHARIDLGAAGATIVDTGSSNGTLLNGKMLAGAAPLRSGDTIQLGYTGPTLTVVELDLSASPTTAAPARPRRALLVGGVSAVAVVAVATVVVALAVIPRHKPVTSGLEAEGSAPATSGVSAPSVQATPTYRKDPDGSSTTPTPSGKRPAPSPVPPVVEDVAKTAPSEDVKEVGSYVALENWVSVLLARQGQDSPWSVLRPEARLSTAHTLVSLPGYRSLAVLDGGVHLTLWGNLPELSAFPPVLESVVMLNAPAAGADLDFTLDRGRVVVSNRKAPEAAARVRVRFLREVWELELADAGSEAALELWSLPYGEPVGAPDRPPAANVGLIAKGKVRVKTPRESLDLAGPVRLSWVSRQPATLHRTDLPELPAWWAKPPDRKAPGVEKAMRSLLDWSDLLGGSNTDPAKRKTPANGGTPVVTTIKTQVEEVKDPDNQDVGVFFLAALDELEPLLDLLKDRQNPNVRGVTRSALQAWLSRGSRHGRDLVRLLERRGASNDEGERIVRLLHFLPPEALGEKKTYEELVGFLDDDSLLVRDLAFWQLDQLGVGGWLPEEARKIPYDPTWERDKRKPAIEQWKRLIREGKVPKRPA